MWSLWRWWFLSNVYTDEGYLVCARVHVRAWVCVCVCVCISLSQSLWYISQKIIEILNKKNLFFLFNLYINVSLVPIKKTVSHFFEQVANALVPPCKWLWTILCCSLNYQLLMLCWTRCIVMDLYWIVSRPQHLGISSLQKSLHAKWLNKLS